MRRLALILSVVATAIVALASAPSIQRELSRDEQAIHALSRLAFGPRPVDLERVK